MTLTKRELEIAKLREKEKQTFKVIGKHFGISASRASRIYHLVQRKRRTAKRQALLLPENQVILSFSLSRGEAIVLDKLLSATLEGHLDYHLQIESHKLDPDYLCAAKLQKRLSALLQPFGTE